MRTKLTILVFVFASLLWISGEMVYAIQKDDQLTISYRNSDNYTSLQTSLLYHFDDFSNVSSFTFNGDTLQINDGNQDVIRLTPTGIGKVGSAFVSTPITISSDTSFQTYFEFRFHPGSGADGMYFVLQNDPNKNNALGGDGSGMGYTFNNGGGPINNSIGIGFNTWVNNIVKIVGVTGDGTTTTLSSQSAPFVLGNGASRYVWIDYDGSTNVLDVYLSAANTKPLNPFLSQVVDLPNYVGNQAYLGFTAGTGISSHNHDIRAWTFSNSDNVNEIENGLVACYPFAGNANDGSGNNNHGTVQGATLTTDRFGQTNQAYRFDGSNDYIRVADSESLDITEEISLVAWMNFETGGTFSPRILHKQRAYELYTFGTDSSRPVNFGLNVSSGVTQITLNSASTFDQGEWVFLVATYDGAKTKLYGNGILLAEEDFSTSIVNSNSPLEIGRNGFNGLDDFKGVIDDIRIYSRALTEDEILELYNAKEEQNCIDTQEGSITIINKTTPANATDFMFSGHLGNFTLDDNESFTKSNLAAGTYHISEDKNTLPDEYWALLSVQCKILGGETFYPTVRNTETYYGVDLPLQAGQDLICTLLHEQANFFDGATYRVHLPTIFLAQ